MVDDNDYREGFVQGYRAVRGSTVIIPVIPVQPVTKVGQTPFRMGLRNGIAAGFRNKGVEPPEF